MLTSNDIKYLVGLLCSVTSPDNVDIILGDMVYDQAAEKKRDVDITIKYKDEYGNEISFVGIEVKDHSRKLGTDTVEQLCLKFKDSPAIKKGGIVSATGFTKGAIKKATHHNIELYSLKDWDYKAENFGHINISDNFKIYETINQWVNETKADLQFTEDVPEDYMPYLTGDNNVLDLNRNKIEGIENLIQLCNKFRALSITPNEAQEHYNNMEIGEEKTITKEIIVADTPLIFIKDKYFNLEKLSIKGNIKKDENLTPLEFKILVKHNNENFRIGCIITLMSSGNLIGFSIPIDNRTMHLLNIPLSERLKEKLYKIKIK